MAKAVQTSTDSQAQKPTLFPQWTRRGRAMGQLARTLLEVPGAIDHILAANAIEVAMSTPEPNRLSRLVTAWERALTGRPDKTLFRELTRDVASDGGLEGLREIVDMLSLVAAAATTANLPLPPGAEKLAAYYDRHEERIGDDVYARYDSQRYQMVASVLARHVNLPRGLQSTILDMARGGSRNPHEIATAFRDITTLVDGLERDNGVTDVLVATLEGWIDDMAKGNGSVAPSHALRELSANTVLRNDDLLLQLTDRQVEALDANAPTGTTIEI